MNGLTIGPLSLEACLLIVEKSLESYELSIFSRLEAYLINGLSLFYILMVVLTWLVFLSNSLLELFELFYLLSGGRWSWLGFDSLIGGSDETICEELLLLIISLYIYFLLPLPWYTFSPYLNLFTICWMSFFCGLGFFLYRIGAITLFSFCESGLLESWQPIWFKLRSGGRSGWNTYITYKGVLITEPYFDRII